MRKQLCAVIPFLSLFLSSSVSAQISFQSLNTSISADLLGISFADSSTGFACGEGGTIIKTTDGGGSWTTLNTGVSVKLWDIEVIPNSGGQKIIAVGDDNTVIKSMNGGSSWTSQSIPFQTGSFVFGIHCLDSLNYYACGGDYATFSGAVLKTTNGGANWTKTTVSSSVFLDKIFMFPTGHGFAVGTNTSFSDGSIQKASGSSFISVKTSASIITDVWCHSPASIVAVGLGGQILVSVDSGSTWTSKSFNNEDLYCVRFADNNHGFACGGSPSGGIILSTNNGGNSWSSHSFTFNGTFQSISLIEDKIFIAGDAGTIIKATLPNFNSQKDINPYKLLLYPNPSTGKLNLDNPYAIDGLQVEVTDYTGRIVYSAECDFGGTDLSFLPKGWYTYRLSRQGVNLSRGKLILTD